ncbi:TetR/AcrR family transcriptional regulator [Vagococcus lutrae]|uniref:TetR/AcrR family transcriptional regulator n=1 Tax=Vagococcus lutrae TaxID=81947 RepID=UPI001C9593E2|nr:TetR/AcrR family transcriptional regulator [Vagococcus lutrae]MDT2801392.1 TetR/AcrR family transcriptional regulator [Vagococcus lutrae]MDT2817273.1 TetR/AcrR family transcriptional regulator [Vagococcus lutrae]MDT2841539.1 TetR/AcrR family transcriptional regulator [Vagococcus lutrae]QZN88596.1 TetR/AcrR family transcriptional regulator [Vagococcus lutrae]
MEKVDPRVLKTRSKLKAAFLTLLSKNQIQEINVKNLTETAEVTRGTFYLHYRDKEFFVETMMSEIIDEFFYETMIPDTEDETVYRFSLMKYLEFAEFHTSFFKTLIYDSNSELYRQKVIDRLSEEIQTYQKHYKKDRTCIPQTILMNYLMYTLLGYVDGWDANGKIYATRYMAENLSKILDSQFIEEAGIVDFFYGPENQETVNKGQ